MGQSQPRAAVALLCVLLLGMAACTYTGPPEDERWPQNDHGHPG